MKKTYLAPVAIVALLLSCLCTRAEAQNNDSVGLGVSFGVALPQHKTDEVQFDDWDASFGWGFYGNIPAVDTFQITPSALLYPLYTLNATDVNLAFKFIIPAWVLDIYVGLAPGVTTVADDHLFNVGGIVGVSFNLFSNLDLFIDAKYKILIEGDSNIRVLHAAAGVLWHF